MDVIIKNESGYRQSVEGIGFSYGINDFDRLEGVAVKLCDKDGGHNKFLESIIVWIEITAARYWWAEFDTYRVGTTKQSESTIHTIARKPLTQDDFSHEIFNPTLEFINEQITKYNKIGDNSGLKKALFNSIKANLPEGYLQKRMVCTNYKSISNMIAQRKNHVLKEWHYFIEEVLKQLEHSELLTKKYGGEEPWKLRE